jgi:hypothetical protein
MSNTPPSAQRTHELSRIYARGALAAAQGRDRRVSRAMLKACDAEAIRAWCAGYDNETRFRRAQRPLPKPVGTPDLHARSTI